MANAFYEIIIGTGFYWCDRYVVETDYPTTNYTALVDALIDYVADKGYSCILDMDNEYEWADDYESIHERANPERVYYPDEYIQGGNCGDVLIHYGEFRINEILEENIGDAEVIRI